jgi:hypothetical protein
MKRTMLMALWIAFVALLPLLAAFNITAQIVGTRKAPGCNVSGTVTVNVSDLSGAAIQNAFVLFRADRLGTSNAKPFQLELRTNSAGRATASVPCGYVDFFAAADGFTPHAAKLLVEEDSSSSSVRLNIYPIIQQ